MTLTTKFIIPCYGPLAMPAFGGHVAGVAVEGRRMLLGRPA